MSYWSPATILPNMTGIPVSILSNDPYLAYRPAFPYSLPIQILCEGITLTLTSVLLVHLLFTTQYHLPLSKTNFFLQLFSIVALLCCDIATIVTIMQQQDASADNWPYMLDYIEVDMPSNNASTGQNAAWCFCRMVVNMAVQMTHIQFLTLLYPSTTERKLIFSLLGPLAFASSALFFTRMSSVRTIIDLGDAIRNVFDSTLLLMFSISVAIWGFLVNRARAWRFDGGTAIFGAGAIALAIGSTGSNFVKIRVDGINWIQNMIWATVLWQSWLGFWWWVGSGMGIGEVEDMVRREERRKVKHHRPQGTNRHRSRGTGDHHERSEQESSTSAWQGLLSTFRQAANSKAAKGMRRRRRSTAEVAPATDTEEIELQDLAEEARRESGPGDPTITRPRLQHHSTITRTLDSSSDSTSQIPLESVSGVLGYPINFLLRFFRQLRSGHEAATKAQVIKRVQARQRAFGSTSSPPAPVPQPDISFTPGRPSLAAAADGSIASPFTSGVGEMHHFLAADNDVGWGLGSFGLREVADGERRVREADRLSRAERLIGGSDGRDSAPQTSSNSRGISSDPDIDADELERGEAMELDDCEDQGEWIDEEIIVPASSSSRTGGQRLSNATSRRASSSAAVHDSASLTSPNAEAEGWSWRGPMRKWRLADRSTFD